MKKIVLFVLFNLMLFNGCVKAQVKGIPYADALTLYNSIRKADDPALVRAILMHYFDTTRVDSALIAQNMFLRRYAGPLNAIMTKRLVVGESTAAGSAIYGLNVANYADGIAKFLIERGKEELSIAFFQKMKDEFNKYPELKYLFPSTSKIIVDIENHNILNLLQELRDAFTKDLTNSPANILSLRNIASTACPPSVPQCLTRVDTIRRFFTGALGNDPRPIIISLNVMQSMINGDNIISTFARVSNDATLCTDTTDVAGYLKLTSLLMEALRTDRESNGLFVSETDLRNLFHSEDLLRILLGLVYQKYNAVPCYQQFRINRNNLASTFNAILTNRRNFYQALVSFDNINAGMRKRSNTGEKTDQASVASASISAVANLFKGVNDILPGTLSTQHRNLLNNFDIGADLCIDIQQRNYPGIFNDVIRFIRENRVMRDTVAQEKVIKYLSFGANLATATTSDEVREAIKAVALPPGSYSVKQRSAYNIAFNAYLGYAWDFRSGPYAHGVYAPLGFTGSVGLGKRGGGALSLYASLIDVGALVSYRLTNGMADSLKQEVRLESIISPSVQLIFGVHKVPVSVAAGWKLTPRLFFEGNKEFTVVEPKNVFNVSLLIDIPVFNIWTRPYE